MADRLDQAISAAVQAGLLPAAAQRPEQEARPWPVVLLTALGAWLSAIPLLAVVGMLLGELFTRGAGPYLVGVALMAGAVAILRARYVPLFVEQLTVPTLLVASGCLGFGIFRDLPGSVGAWLLAFIALGVALATARPWLHVLLGAAMACLVGFALIGPRSFSFGRRGVESIWLAWHGLLLAWLLALWLQRAVLEARPRLAAALESLAAGWLLVTLFGMAWLAGMTFLAGGMVRNAMLMGGDLAGQHDRAVMQALSVVLALLAAGWSAHRWLGVRKPVMAAVAVVLVGLAWWLQTLGAVLLALSVTAGSQRWRQAAAAGLAAAWIIGSFYYQLAWPLATKAQVLAAAGVVLGGLAWWSLRSQALVDRAARALAVPLDRRAAFVGGAIVAALAVASVGIWQKQALIAEGRPVFVELAPVDPRSLMQGDYMRLVFRMPVEVGVTEMSGLGAQHPRVVARRDPRGVATLLRMASASEALGPDELLMELTPKNGGWVLVTDAWFFKEGDAQRWERAKYGEFRVAPDGRALLVGMADGELKAIAP